MRNPFDPGDLHWRGKVCWVGEARNNAITTSSNEAINAKIAPVKIPGKFSGKVVVKKAFSGETPRLIAARTTNHRWAYISDIISENQVS